MLQTILVPVDDSDRARGVLPFVQTLAQRAHASVILLHVDPDPVLREHAEHMLERITRELAPSGVAVTSEIVDGEPVASIVQRAQDHHADLICMTTTRASDFDRWLNGSVMDGVLRHARMPLLVLPPECTAPWVETTDPVLVALDGSPAAEQVLPIAAELAGILKAPLCLFRADRDEVAADEYLTSVRAQCAGLDVHTRVARGAAASSIVATARSERAPLIAMATHGRSGVARLALGSVSTQVLHAAAVPLLLVHPAVAAEGHAAGEVPTPSEVPWVIA